MNKEMLKSCPYCKCKVTFILNGKVYSCSTCLVKNIRDLSICGHYEVKVKALWNEEKSQWNP